MGRPKLTRYQSAARKKEGKEIRGARERLLLTQSALAAQLELHAQQISAAERGVDSAPTALRAWLTDMQGE